MDRQSSGLDFAIIGHQESWRTVLPIINGMRKEESLPGLSFASVQQHYSYIPPRPLFEVEAKSITGRPVKGVYIETFISPDEGDAAHLHSNIAKVREACSCAARMGARICALGGLTSIVLEAAGSPFTQLGDTVFTTGNTLTAAFVVKGVEGACRVARKPLSELRLLIIGSTGDIGSACVRYFTGKVGTLLLHARRPGPLRLQAGMLEGQDQAVRWSIHLDELLPQATFVIAVASTPVSSADPTLLPSGAIVCDAGYPKNCGGLFAGRSRGFSGGLGHICEGYRFQPACYHRSYGFPLPNIVHGCLLETMVLAMEERWVPYSSGRGHITVEKMDHILRLAGEHGITTAPLFDDNGRWEETKRVKVHGSY